MRLLIETLACAVALTLAAPVALADDRGAGLYEPFAGGASTKAAKRYVTRLAQGRLPAGRSLSASIPALKYGVFVNEGRPVRAKDTPRAGAATARAARSDDAGPGLSASLGVAAVALGLGAAGAARRRNR